MSGGRRKGRDPTKHGLRPVRAASCSEFSNEPRVVGSFDLEDRLSVLLQGYSYGWSAVVSPHREHPYERQLTRLTNAFSKRVESLGAALWL